MDGFELANCVNTVSSNFPNFQKLEIFKFEFEKCNKIECISQLKSTHGVGCVYYCLNDTVYKGLWVHKASKTMNFRKLKNFSIKE